MCNAKEDDELMVDTKFKFTEKGTKCRKCDEIGKVVLQIKDVYCSDCFLSFCSHKFRSILGKSRIFHGNSTKPVLIAFSGSTSSVALLKLVADGINLDHAQRRLMAQPSIIYIDEGAILKETIETRQQRYTEILSILKQYKFPSYIVPINAGNITPIEFNDKTTVNTIHDESVAALLNSFPDLSGKIDMLQRIRHRVLLDAAINLGFDKVFLADTATGLAIKILTSIALGRGSQIPYETGFLDNREEKVVFIRPMKEFNSKEVAYFNQFNNLSSVSIPSLLTMSKCDGSIQRLTEEFVVSVQQDFPSTVSTIYRTGDKLQVVSSKEICLLCHGPIDTENSSSLQATEFSRKLSSSKCCNSSCECELNKEDIVKYLCYSCRLLVINMSSYENLPEDIITKVKEQMTLNKMKNDIQEFLLE